METGPAHGEGGPVPESMKEFLEAIHAGCSIDIYNEGSEHLGDTFLQSIDDMAMQTESHEAQSISGHIKQGGHNHSHAGGDNNETSVPWTYESLLLLIKTVEKYPELWDNQYIYSIYSRHARWETVTGILNTTVDEFKINPVNAQDVTSKWRRLRGQKTIMEKNKHKHGMQRTPRIPNEFSYYNHMDFIFYPPSKRPREDGVAFPTEKLSQHDSKVKWNYQSAMALISEVKKYPVIWASSKGHPPSTARTKAYCTVLEFLNSSVPAFIENNITMNDLRWKWKNLRGYMNRCVKNLKKGNSNSEWEFFHAMEFLYPNHSLQSQDSTPESSHGQVSIKQEKKADTNTSNMDSQKMTVDSYSGRIGINQDLGNLQPDSSNNGNKETQREAVESSAGCIGMDKDHEANEVPKSKRKWNYETTMTIINEIKKYPVIWDTSNNSTLIEEKFAAYEAIITYLNSSVPAFIKNPITVKDLSWKWKHLRNYKMRCLRSLKTNTNLREWEFFASLDFIEGNCSESAPPKRDPSCVSVDNLESRVDHKKSNEELYRDNQQEGSANDKNRKSNVRWNRMKTMALIDEVKKYPKLWNVESRQSASYNYEVYAANKKVVADLNDSVPDFKKNPITIRDLIYKWKNLRAYKMRCLRNLSTNPNLRRWEFFAALDFLEGIVPEQAPIKQDSTCVSVDNQESGGDCKNIDEEYDREKHVDGSDNDKNMADEENAREEEAQDAEDANAPENEKSNIRWNYIRTMALINEVKKYTVLWNDMSRHNATYVAEINKANQKVVSHLNSSVPDFMENPVTVKDMKLKWRHLRQYARRCMRNKSTSGKEWEFYNAMDFLIAESPILEEYPKSEVKWNRHSIMALITEVKKYPQLWHYSSRSTMDHAEKYNMFKAQKNIVAHLNATVPTFRKNRITISDMRYKWRCLRGYMTRCLKAEFTTGKKWEFYNALFFLSPHYTQDNSSEDSTCDASNNKDYYNPYEPAIELNYDSTDDQMDQSPEEHLKNMGEETRRRASVHSHSVIPSHMLDATAPHRVASTGFGNTPNIPCSSSELCAVALLQIKHAFSVNPPSEEKQMNFYQSISQLCAQFIGGSDRRCSDRDADN